MRFFMYADNLNPTQLKQRAPEHQLLFKAYIPDHTITFGRWSNQWRCGLGTITPSAGERVWGAVFELTQEDVQELDKFDGDIPEEAFRHVEINVFTEDDQKEFVTTHVGQAIGKFKPKEHYIDWVMAGVRHWKLPEECIDMWDLSRIRSPQTAP